MKRMRGWNEQTEQRIRGLHRVTWARYRMRRLIEEMGKTWISLEGMLPAGADLPPSVSVTPALDEISEAVERLCDDLARALREESAR